MKIYIVEQGEYSDRHIVAVFSTLELAEAFTVSFVIPGERYSTLDVSEYEIDVPTDSDFKGLLAFKVTLEDNGDVKEVRRTDNVDSVLAGGHRPPGIDVWPGQPEHGYRVYCLARNEGHAIKIAGDRRAVYLSGVGQKS